MRSVPATAPPLIGVELQAADAQLDGANGLENSGNWSS